MNVSLLFKVCTSYYLYISFCYQILMSGAVGYRSYVESVYTVHALIQFHDCRMTITFLKAMQYVILPLYARNEKIIFHLFQRLNGNSYIIRQVEIILKLLNNYESPILIILFVYCWSDIIVLICLFCDRVAIPRRVNWQPSKSWTLQK